MPRAFIIGGTGATGRATATYLLREGWQVDLTGRDPTHMPVQLAAAGVTFTAIDRDDPGEPGQLMDVLGDGADLVVDATCFTAADATRLLALAARAASTVMLSSKAVYVDAVGNHSNSTTPPCFPVPISEEQPTLAPAGADHPGFESAEGYGAHKVAAEQVLLDSGLPVSVLRASKVHGAGSRRPREWVFVKRALDRRPVLLLAGGGTAVDHPSAAVNIAALIATVASAPATRVLNAADPDAPNVLAISRTVAALAGHCWAEVLLDPSAPLDHGADGNILGATPWNVPDPIVLDTTAAEALGYRPVGDYAATVADEIRWLIHAASGGPEAHLLPGDNDPFFAPFLDYSAEDAYLADHPLRRGRAR